MEDLTSDEAAWIRTAAAAFLAIRIATQSRPDDEQTRDINFLADALHNIGMAGTGNPLFSTLHTAEDMATVQQVTQQLLHSVHKPHARKLSLIEGLFRTRS